MYPLTIAIAIAIYSNMRIEDILRKILERYIYLGNYLDMMTCGNILRDVLGCLSRDLVGM